MHELHKVLDESGTADDLRVQVSGAKVIDRGAISTLVEQVTERLTAVEARIFASRSADLTPSASDIEERTGLWDLKRALHRARSTHSVAEGPTAAGNRARAAASPAATELTPQKAQLPTDDTVQDSEIPYSPAKSVGSPTPEKQADLIAGINTAADEAASASAANSRAEVGPVTDGTSEEESERDAALATAPPQGVTAPSGTTATLPDALPWNDHWRQAFAMDSAEQLQTLRNQLAIDLDSGRGDPDVLTQRMTWIDQVLVWRRVSGNGDPRPVGGDFFDTRVRSIGRNVQITGGSAQDVDQLTEPIARLQISTPDVAGLTLHLGRAEPAPGTPFAMYDLPSDTLTVHPGWEAQRRDFVEAIVARADLGYPRMLNNQADPPRSQVQTAAPDPTPDAGDFDSPSTEKTAGEPGTAAGLNPGDRIRLEGNTYVIKDVDHGSQHVHLRMLPIDGPVAGPIPIIRLENWAPHRDVDLISAEVATKQQSDEGQGPAISTTTSSVGRPVADAETGDNVQTTIQLSVGQPPSATEPDPESHPGFDSVDMVLAHWARGGYTNSSHPEDVRLDEMTAQAALKEITVAELSPGGAFVIGRRPSDDRWILKIAATGATAAGLNDRMALTSGDHALAAAQALEEMHLAGTPFDWTSPGLPLRLRDRRIRQELVEAVQFAWSVRTPELLAERVRAAETSPHAPQTSKPLPVELAEQPEPNVAEQPPTEAELSPGRGASILVGPSNEPDPPIGSDTEKTKAPDEREDGDRDGDSGPDELLGDRRGPLASVAPEPLLGHDADGTSDLLRRPGGGGAAAGGSDLAEPGRPGSAGGGHPGEDAQAGDSTGERGVGSGEPDPAAGSGERPPRPGPAELDQDRPQPSTPGPGELRRWPGAPVFRPTGQQDLAPVSTRQKAQANIAALQTLRTLQQEERPATAIEQQVLARWAGWGALAEAMWGTNPKNAETYAREREQLPGLLSEEEILAARRSTMNAHYTDAAIVQTIWDAVQALGFEGGQVLELGSGSGTFMGLAPPETDMVGVELDPITAALSQYLYPTATVFNTSLADFTVPDGTFDAAIGNVPFAGVKPFDRIANPSRTHSLHNLAIIKAVNATRPGGLVAVLTSSYTMDSAGDAHRQAIYDRADLVAGVRLPTGAHRAAAGTDVVTDLLIFRRRLSEQKPGPDTWLETRQLLGPGDDQTVTVNAHFLLNPDMVLGELRVGAGPNGRAEVVVHGQPLETAQQLRNVLNRTVEAAQHKGLTYLPAEEGRESTPVAKVFAAGVGLHEGHLQIDGDGFTIVRGGRHQPIDVPKSHTRRLRELLHLRDSAAQVLELDLATEADTPATDAARAKLNLLYRRYVARYKAINDSAWVKSSPKDTPLETPQRNVPLNALTTMDIITHPGLTQGGSTRKAVVMGHEPDGAVRIHVIGQQGKAREQILDPYIRPTEVSSGHGPELRVRTVDVIGRRQERTRLARQTPPVFDRDPMAGLVYALESYDPETNTSTPGTLLTTRALRARTGPGVIANPDDALSLVVDADGDVDLPRIAALMGVDEQQARQLLDRRVFQDPERDRLVAREEYLSGDVRAKLRQAEAAATTDPAFAANVEELREALPEWMGSDRIRPALGATWIAPTIIQQFLRELVDDPEASVTRISGSTWTVEGHRSSADVLVGQEWGTEDRDAYDILDALLHRRTIKITRHPQNEPSYVDQPATDAAIARAEKMQERFREWIWDDPTRAEELLTTYNDRFNTLVARGYSTAPLNPEGMSETFTLYGHQASGVRRILNEPTVLLAHDVGAGKTLTMATAAMELRRLGHASKPTIVVPSHMKEQWQREFLAGFPTAKLLAVSSDDLDRAGRGQFLAKMATGDWDTIIITKDAFQRINVSKATNRDYIHRQLAQMREAVETARKADEDGEGSEKTVKKLEDALARREEKLKAKLDGRRDDGLSFEQLGIDYLFIDEAHAYKNLERLSVTDEALTGSDIATDLDMKLDYLRQVSTSGRIATLATATPIANSIGEIHTMLKYTRPDLLEAAGLEEFDAFLATFAQAETKFEMSPDGGSWVPKTRLRKFFNMPGLLRMWQQTADVMSAEALDLDVPDIDGGRPEVVIVPATDWLREEYTPRLVARAEASKASRRDGAGSDNILVVNNDGKAAALDPRMVGGPPDPAGGKLGAVAERAAAIYTETKDNIYVDPATGKRHPRRGAFQIIFLDQGTPGADKRFTKKIAAHQADPRNNPRPVGDSVGFDAYAELKRQLVTMGVPQEQIAFVHDAGGRDDKKAALFRQAREGAISVLVGSTPLMGVGTNIQDRSVALHDVDCPYRPADIAQRHGRVVRQKNQNGTVRILQYATRGSLDVRLWDTQERKAAVIGQVMRGDLSVDEVEELSPTVLNAAEMKAAASGNQTLLDKVATDQELQKYRSRSQDFHRARKNAAWTIQTSTATQARTRQTIQVLDEVLPRLARTSDGSFTLALGPNGANPAKRTDANDLIREELRHAANQHHGRDDGPPVSIGTIGGFTVIARGVLNWRDNHRNVVMDFPELPDASAAIDVADIATADPLIRLTNILNDLPRRRGSHIAALPDLERNIANAHRQLDKEFTDEPRLAALEKRAQRLNDLMAWQSAPASPARPSAVEDETEEAEEPGPTQDAPANSGSTPEETPAALLTDPPDVIEILGPLASESGEIEARPPPSSLRNLAADGTPLPRTNSWLRRRNTPPAQDQVLEPEHTTAVAEPTSSTASLAAPAQTEPTTTAPQIRRLNPNLSQIYQAEGDPQQSADVVLFIVQQAAPGKWVVYQAGEHDPLVSVDAREGGEQWALQKASQQSPQDAPTASTGGVSVSEIDQSVLEAAQSQPELPAPEIRVRPGETEAQPSSPATTVLGAAETLDFDVPIPAVRHPDQQRLLIGMHYDGRYVVVQSDARHAENLVKAGLARWDTSGAHPFIEPTDVGLKEAEPLVAEEESNQRRPQDVQVGDVLYLLGHEPWVVQDLRHDDGLIHADGRLVGGMNAGASVHQEWPPQDRSERPSLYLCRQFDREAIDAITSMAPAYLDAIDALVSVDADDEHHVRPWLHDAIREIYSASADPALTPADGLERLSARLREGGAAFDDGHGDRNGTRTGLQSMADRLDMIVSTASGVDQTEQRSRRVPGRVWTEDGTDFLREQYRTGWGRYTQAELRARITEKIDQLHWRTPEGRLPPSVGDALSAYIESAQIQNVSAIATSGSLRVPDGPETATYGLYGIEAHHPDRFRVYLLATGLAVYPLAIDHTVLEPALAITGEAEVLEHAELREHGKRWRDLCAGVDPRLPDDPHYPALAAAMTRAHDAGTDLANLMPTLIDNLNPDHPGRDLHTRLIGATDAARTPSSLKADISDPRSAPVAPPPVTAPPLTARPR